MTYRIVKMEENVSRNTFNLHIEQIETREVRIMQDVRIWDNDNEALEDMFHFEEA